MPCRRSRRDGRDMVLNVYTRLIRLLSDVNIKALMLLCGRNETTSAHVFSLWRNADVGSVCQNGLRTRAHNVLPAFAFLSFIEVC